MNAARSALLLLAGFMLGAVITMSQCSRAEWPEPWTNQQVKLAWVWGGLQAVDWRQTREIADHPDRYHENNPWLDEHPSRREVDRHFIATTILHLGAVHILPSRWRAPFQWVAIAYEADKVYSNYQLGVRITIPI